MSTPPDIKYHECEIVISIVLKIPIYIEPVVIEKNGVCHERPQQKPNIKLLEAEPVLLTDAGRTDADSDMTVGSVYSFTRLWERLSQSTAGLWHAFAQWGNNSLSESLGCQRGGIVDSLARWAESNLAFEALFDSAD